MLYQFITDADLAVGLQKYFSDQISANAVNGIPLSEGAALSIIKAKINNRYDLTQLFPVITEWDGSIAYAIGAYVCRLDTMYIALTANTGQDPSIALSPNWAKKDPRDQLLIMKCLDITIYFFVRSANARKITQDMADNYASALEWLDDVKNQIENPAWPLLIDAASIPIAGSKPPEQQYRW